MHAGVAESWIAARAATKRGRGTAPRHAAGGRHAAAPGPIKLAVMRITRTQSFGWTPESVAHAARIGA